MDLKIDDVAQLLSVTEETIQKWLLKGKIPAYKISDEYRFSRIEIENWMMSSNVDIDCGSIQQERSCRSIPSEEKGHGALRGGLQQFLLYRAIHKGATFTDIEGSAKEEIIRATLARVSPQLGFDAEVVSEMFLDREKLMSTSLGHGVAVPHSREFVLQGPGSDAVVVVFLKNPIEFHALDGIAVHTLFFLFSSDDKKHLQLLAKIAHLTLSKDAMQILKQKPSKETFLQFIREWESQLHS